MGFYKVLEYNEDGSFSGEILPEKDPEKEMHYSSPEEVYKGLMRADLTEDILEREDVYIAEQERIGWVPMENLSPRRAYFPDDRSAFQELEDDF